MTYPVWPWRLLPAMTQQPYLTSNAAMGPPSTDGTFSQIVRTDGGGSWRLDLTGINACEPDLIRALRAWSGYLEGGVGRFILPLWDLGMAPRPIIGGLPQPPAMPAPAENYFSEVAQLGNPLIVASLVDAAVLRATTVKIRMRQGGGPVGGEHFSIQHPQKDWRLYRIIRPTLIDDGSYSCTIRPPLRQAITGGEDAEFDVPRCVMNLHPDSANSLEPRVENNTYADSVSGSFVEAFF